MFSATQTSMMSYNYNYMTSLRLMPVLVMLIYSHNGNRCASIKIGNHSIMCTQMETIV